MAKGTTVGVITDVDGKFTLSGIQVLQRLCRFHILVCRLLK
ncbi:carboxypeptidase-like regulatory domain-containing protein [Bacteroides fragilis]|nr:carboxypeptidase-like regulatory domain-containing protein [Bacteroides fragilis]